MANTRADERDAKPRYIITRGAATAQFTDIRTAIESCEKQLAQEPHETFYVCRLVATVDHELIPRTRRHGLP